jgi:glycosyltransferase involved in cell wall biosynthesis
MWHVVKTPHDILYTKSFFSVPFSLWPIWMHLLGILRKPIVVAPSGEFAHSALLLKKHRKRIYLRIARWLDVYVHTIWHATSEYEAQDVKRAFGSKTRTITARSIGFIGEEQPETRLRIAVASELASSERPRRNDGVRPAKVRGELRAVFLARVARVKNLEGAIKYLFDLHGRVLFDIYGPLEDERYWAACKETMAKLPANIHVRYLGPVPHQAVDLILREYQLLLLPTLGENFGYSILEALLAGLPILISDQTPWRGLQGEGVGWDLPLNEPERVRDALQRCVDMGPEEHGAMALRARVYGVKHSQDPNVVSHNREMFQSALG